MSVPHVYWCLLYCYMNVSCSVVFLSIFRCENVLLYF